VKVVSVVSAKGGVGKTSSAANLSVALTKLGAKVLAIDMDPQNALGLHFGLSPAERLGSVQSVVERQPIASAVFNSPSGARVLPYGMVEEEDREAFERYLDEYPGWLNDTLQALKLGRNEIVVVDTPPGPSAYLRQALRSADLAVVVALPDAASYATLGLMNRLVMSYCQSNTHFKGHYYLINQLDSSRTLARDVVQIVRDRHGDRLLGSIHQDQAVSEALACDQSTLEYDPYCVASQDYNDCATHLLKLLEQA